MRRYGMVDRYAAGKHVLDCPCGVGWGSSLLVSAKTVTGVDICPEAIAFANTYYSSERIEFMAADMARLNLSRTFDLVVFLEGLEHVEKDAGRECLKAFQAHLAPEGRLFFSVPIKESGPVRNPYHCSFYSYEEVSTPPERTVPS